MPIGPGSFIAVTPGSGAKLATGPTYTENANVVQDEKVVLGEQYVASYTVNSGVVSIGTAGSHVLQIMAGASLKVRVRRIEIWPEAAATTANNTDLRIYRLTSAGTGGTAVVPQALDTADAASGATAMTLPTVKGTEAAASIWEGNWAAWQTMPTNAVIGGPVYIDFVRVFGKPLVIAAGIANGMALKFVSGIASASVAITAYFDETAY